MTTLASRGVGFQQALFVPPESSYRKLGAQQQHQDLSLQHRLQKVYQTYLTSSSNAVSCLLTHQIRLADWLKAAAPVSFALWACKREQRRGCMQWGGTVSVEELRIMP